MPVPAFRNSRSKVRRRRSHHALKPTQLLQDQETGAYRLPHYVVETESVKPAPTKSKKTKAVKEAAATEPAASTTETAGEAPASTAK